MIKIKTTTLWIIFKLLYLVNYLGASQHGDIVTTLISFALCYTELRFGITTQISVILKIQCVYPVNYLGALWLR